MCICVFFSKFVYTCLVRVEEKKIFILGNYGMRKEYLLPTIFGKESIKSHKHKSKTLSHRTPTESESHSLVI